MTKAEDYLVKILDGITEPEDLVYFTGIGPIESAKILEYRDEICKRMEKGEEYIGRNFCKECDGEGRWYDPSHGASRSCKNCDGKGHHD